MPPNTPKQSARIPWVGLIVLYAIQIFGVNAMYGQLYRRGHADAIQALLEDGAHYLPGSKNLIRKHYTGWPAMDRLVAMGNIVWSNVADGSSPPLSLFAFHFGGQLVPIITVLAIEGLRLGNKRNVILLSSGWALLMQIMGYGFVMPIYAIAHILLTVYAPNQSDTVRVQDSVKLDTLSAGFLLGYLPLSVLLAYPFEDSSTHQWWNAVWQGFPLHVAIWQYLFAEIYKRIQPGQGPATESDRVQQDRKALRGAYSFAYKVSALTHLSTFAIIGAAQFYPHLLPEFLQKHFTLSNVFLFGPLYSEETASPATIMHEFFGYDYYVGSAATITWAATLLSMTRSSSVGGQAWVSTLKGAVWDFLVAGPGGVFISLLQARDEEVLSEALRSETKRR